MTGVRAETGMTKELNLAHALATMDGASHASWLIVISLSHKIRRESLKIVPIHARCCRIRVLQDTEFGSGHDVLLAYSGPDLVRHFLSGHMHSA